MYLRLRGVHRIMVHGEWWEVVPGSAERESDLNLTVSTDNNEKNIRLWNDTIAVEVAGERPVKRFVRLDEIEAFEIWREENQLS